MRTYDFEFWALPKVVAEDTELDWSDKAILSILITMANTAGVDENGDEDERGEFRIKQKTIAKRLNLGVRTVKLSMKKLESMGFVSSRRIFKTLCNRYQFQHSKLFDKEAIIKAGSRKK